MRVADDGPGIPADRLPHLFERFYRGGTPARRRDDGGAGLGLAIAQEIVQTFEGTISMESSVGHGTAFVVRFPVIAGPPDDALDDRTTHEDENNRKPPLDTAIGVLDEA